MAEWRATIPGPRAIIDWTEAEQNGGRQTGLTSRSARMYHAWMESWMPRVRRWAEFQDVNLEDLEAVLDEFHTYAFVPRFSDCPEDLDAVLEGLYDWADAQRVWIDPINPWALPEMEPS